MLLIHCPYCEDDRSELEFRWAGEAHIARPEDIAEITDEAFADYFFLRDNDKGVTYERWRHIHGCGRFFNAARDTVSDRFLTTYRAGLVKQPVADVAATEQTIETYEQTEGDAR
ncbi:MAG: sarcosine oxidase subunit delta [Rhizobiales bacterium]|nr:sarcosine oxidase subunit delta [Hyphomicrobiales bacterium]